MKYMPIILTFTFSLFAQYEWSEPMTLSSIGTYPEVRYLYPSVVATNDGSIFAFWTKNIQIGSNLQWYSHIECRKSNDGGLTWTIVSNITPEYTTERIYELNAVCDSQNNIHLVYLRGNLGYKVIYKKYDGITWSAPYEISNTAVINLRLGIDKEDRIFTTWYSGSKTNYSYCDVNDSNSTWSEVKPVSNADYGINAQFVYDEMNNLYSVGKSVNPTYPYFFRFTKQSGEWSFEKMFNNKYNGTALVLTSQNSFHSIISNGSTNFDNYNYESCKHESDSTWSSPLLVNEDNDWSYKQMFADKNDNFHLFETHLDITVGILYSVKQQNKWQTTIVRLDSLNNYSYLNASFDYSDKLYLSYNKFNINNSTSQIDFQTKKIDTGIDHSNEVKGSVLYQNYPNPFNNNTQIQFSLEKASAVEFRIYNAKGEFIQDVVSAKLKRGNHSYIFKADKINSGIYYYQLVTDGIVKETKKMLYLK
jgi:hypothetical protein